MEAGVIVVAGLVTLDHKVLLVREGELLQLPGGKQESEETKLDCLRREFNEEIPEAIIVGHPTYWRTFKGFTSPRREYPLTISVYRVHIEWGPDVPRSEDEPVSEVLWWQRSLGMAELVRPTQTVLKAAMKERFFKFLEV